MSKFKIHAQLEQDSIFIADLPLCQLRLINDRQYPWFVLVPRIADATEIYQLEPAQQLRLLQESSALAELLMQEFNGYKLNVAAIGNMVPQLHLHHIVRFKTDASWPKPVWGQLPAIPYCSAELELLKNKLSSALSVLGVHVS